VYKAFGHIDLLPWVAVSYSLANASTIPIARKAATFFDLRPFLFISLTLFVVGAAICGAAPDIKVLIVGRVLNGIGAAAVYQMFVVASLLLSLRVPCVKVELRSRPN